MTYGTAPGISAPEYPEWYLLLQAAVLRHLPPPDAIGEDAALAWAGRGEALAQALSTALASPELEPRPEFQPQPEAEVPSPVPVQHQFDSDLSPRVPRGFSLKGKATEHRNMGMVALELRDGTLYANRQEIVRHISPSQLNGKGIEGHKLREELRTKTVLNACVRDYLFDHPEIIPESWKEGATYFWGTIFRDSVGFLCVACLRWSGHKWVWSYYWLGHFWRAGELAAVLGG